MSNDTNNFTTEGFLDKDLSKWKQDEYLNEIEAYRTLELIGEDEYSAFQNNEARKAAVLSLRAKHGTIIRDENGEVLRVAFEDKNDAENDENDAENAGDGENESQSDEAEKTNLRVALQPYSQEGLVDSKTAEEAVQEGPEAVKALIKDLQEKKATLEGTKEPADTDDESSRERKKEEANADGQYYRGKEVLRVRNRIMNGVLYVEFDTTEGTHRMTPEDFTQNVGPQAA